MALSRCLGSLALLLGGVEAARRKSKRQATHPQGKNAKFIAGVPVLNYHLAYDGKASLGELEDEAVQNWVIMLENTVTDQQIAKMCKSNAIGCLLEGHPSEHGISFLSMLGTETDVAAVVNSCVGCSKYVEPDSQVSIIPELEAGGAGTLAQMEGDAATWGLNRVGANFRAKTGSGTTIFVLDTGIRVSHTEFGGRAVPAIDLTISAPFPYTTCNGDLSCAADTQGHGTHCAGTAASTTYGVAPSAAVMSIKVLGDDGNGVWSWTYGGLDWLAASSIRPAVASMSLGGFGTLQGMADSVNAAVNAGVTVVVAAGNNAADACGYSPAFVPAAITVGSTESNDARSLFSNYGSCVDIWAPGSDVLSLSQLSDDGTTSLSGTSMACPHVAGAAALVLEEDPTKTSAGVQAELVASAVAGEIDGLMAGDTDLLLYVGQFSSLVCPAGSAGPDSDGDCKCNTDVSCAETGSAGCTYSLTASASKLSLRYFRVTCSECSCV